MVPRGTSSNREISRYNWTLIVSNEANNDLDSDIQRRFDEKFQILIGPVRDFR